MEYSIPVTPRIRDLVAEGVITISVHISRDGTDVWARCVQPHPRLGVGTNESLTLDDLEEKLAKVSLRGSKAVENLTENLGKVSLKDSKLSKISAEAGETSRSQDSPGVYGFVSIKDAIAYSTNAGLNMHTNAQGVMNFLPKDSLTPADFNRPAKAIYARACSVADALGTPKLVSRITSQADVLRVNGSVNLLDWWSNATPLQRFILLTKQKVFPREGGEFKIQSKWLKALKTLQHPFRDAEAQVGQSEVELSAEDSSSDQDPTEKETGATLTGW
jgi:hypothetical protein